MNLVNEKRNVWVIVDSKGNYVRENCIAEVEEGVFVYISYHTFSRECRAQGNLLRATNLISDLRDKAMYVGLNETFRLEYVDLSELTREHNNFIGENMIVLDINIFPSSNMVMTPAVVVKKSEKSNVIKLPYPLTV